MLAPLICIGLMHICGMQLLNRAGLSSDVGLAMTEMLQVCAMCKLLINLAGC